MPITTHLKPSSSITFISFLSIFILISCNKTTGDVTIQQKSVVNPCKQRPSPGPCRAALTRYYYDQKLNQCHAFIWGGCKGQEPFKDLKECKRSCEKM